MSQTNTVIVAHKQNKPPKRAFTSWEKAREWQDEQTTPGEYTLSEALLNGGVGQR